MTSLSISIKRDPAVDAFIGGVIDATQPHPTMREARLIGTTGISLRPFNGGVLIKEILQFGDCGKGEATKALHILIALANEHGVALHGTAKSFSWKPEQIKSSKRLLDWYVKHGFEKVSGSAKEGYRIRYTPGKEA